MRWEGVIRGTEMIKAMGYVLYSENIMGIMIIGLILLMVMMGLKLLLR